MTLPIRSSYLHRLFKPENYVATLDEICRQLKTLGRIGAIAGQGASGAAVIFAAAAFMGCQPLLIRKGTDSSHARALGHDFEGPCCDNMRYAIVDDLIDSGDTIEHIRDVVAQRMQNPTCMGVVVYAQEEYRFKGRAARWPFPTLSARVEGLQL